MSIQTKINIYIYAIILLLFSCNRNYNNNYINETILGSEIVDSSILISNKILIIDMKLIDTIESIANEFINKVPNQEYICSTISFENIESESISLFITNSMDYVNEDIVKDHILGCYIHKNIPFYFIGKFDSDNRLQNKIFKIEEEVDTTYILSLRKNGSLYIKNDYYYLRKVFSFDNNDNILLNKSNFYSDSIYFIKIDPSYRCNSRSKKIKK